MNFRDRWEEDADGNRFVFTVEMQRRLSEAGLPVEPEALADLGERPAPVRESQSAPPREQQQHQPAQASRDEIEGPATVQIDPMTGKYVGRVKWYNAKKGYGFIMRGGGEEIFFHRSSSKGEPMDFEDGQWILYDVEETHKGPEASEVEPYDGDLS